ncbi:MAG TPA: ABC transporter substrate-binding protein [Chthoniobacteraceae bacterium]|jgi:NitT/TauT family transport system substrate-binding protein|nr:ABC transporter substrate-binding protein [Chthoniobacteraceae bacterium]
MAPSIPRREFLLATLGTLVLAGCKKSVGPAEVTADGLIKIKVGYIGITCEAPLFSAVENGFFKEEGLAVELVKCEWSKYKDVLALGGFDITHHLIMMFLKPIEQGLDVKMTAGVHRGCLRVQSALNGPIKTVHDLRGKRIGVPGMGTPPFIFANRVLGSNGIDPKTEIEWRSYPAGELGLALKKGEIDAIANSEPIGTLLLAEGLVQNVADQATDLPYSEEYCCAVIVNGKFLTNNPVATAKATRAILKGAKWVETNPRAAARLSVEKGYLASNPELNTTAIGHLRYIPSISGGERDVLTAATGMKTAGMLLPNTDVTELSRRAWARLEGVSDEWVNGLTVERLADGQIPPDQAQRLALELATIGTPFLVATCCSPASKIVQ